MSCHVVTAKPRWWVSAMAKLADWLFKADLKRISWMVADACFWMQDRLRKEPASD